MNQYPEKSKLNRTKAKEAGNKTYESGTQCKVCGSYEKYVSSYGCVPCSIESGLKKLNNEELMSKYRTKEKKQTWLDDNPEKRKGYVRKYNNKNTTKKRVKEYYENNKEELRGKNLKRMYGIDVDEYNTLLENQNNVCAICKKECESGKRLAVDHCHESNKVRGLLCTKCNTAIGLFDNSL